MTLEYRVMAHLVSGKPAPPEYLAFIMCDRFKWPWEYARALPLPEALLLLTMAGAEAKATKHG